MHRHSLLRAWRRKSFGRIQASAQLKSRRNHPRRQILAQLLALRRCMRLSPRYFGGRKSVWPRSPRWRKSHTRCLQRKIGYTATVSKKVNFDEAHFFLLGGEIDC